MMDDDDDDDADRAYFPVLRRPKPTVIIHNTEEVTD